MQRTKLDPKHVRDFFYRHALSVRLMTIFFDGIWWLIARGYRGAVSGPTRLVRSWLPVRLPVDERRRQLHSFAVGRTGAGKSVLLHQLARHYLTRDRRPSVVIMDPHGDLAQAVARDRALRQQDRLVFISFSGISGRYVHLNPFELPRPTEEHLNRAQLQFGGAVEQIIGEAFTPRQRTLIRACLGVMLHRPNSTLIDLLRLLGDRDNADLIDYGRSRLPNEVDRQFFAASFGELDYRVTKQALLSRLTDIVRDPVVRRFTCHDSSFDFGAVLEGGKVMVVGFDPSRQSRDTIRSLGQLLTAAIFSHVLGRPPRSRHPIHMLVDECQYFVSPMIADLLGESRKFGLYLTLATQRLEALDGGLQDAILGNVGTLWVGGSRHQTAEKLARETNLSADSIRQLPPLQFYEVGGEQRARRQRLRYLGHRYAVGPEEWGRRKGRQARTYYRAPATPPPVPPHRDWHPDFF